MARAGGRPAGRRGGSEMKLKGGGGAARGREVGERGGKASIRERERESSRAEPNTARVRCTLYICVCVCVCASKRALCYVCASTRFIYVHYECIRAR